MEKPTMESFDPKGEKAFKNFHRSLAIRFGYFHDEEFWWRDLVSLEEFIARQIEKPPTPMTIAEKYGEITVK